MIFNLLQNVLGGVAGIGKISAFSTETVDISAYSAALEGLNLQQAKMALSIKALTEEKRNAILTDMGLISTTGELTTAQLTQLLTNQNRNSADVQALLLRTGLITATAGEATSTNIVTSEKLKELVTTNQLTQAEAQLIAAKAGVTLENNKEAVSFLASIKNKASSMGTGLLNVGTGILTLVKAHPVVSGLTAALTIGIAAVTIYKKRQEEAAKAIAEAYEKSKKSIDNTITTFQDLKGETNDISLEYAALAQGVNLLTNENKNLSLKDYERFLDLSNQLGKLFPSLRRNVDLSGNAILNLSGDVDTIVGSLNNLVLTQQKLANQDIAKNMSGLYAGFYNDLAELKANIKANKTLQDTIEKSYKFLKSITEQKISFSNGFSTAGISFNDYYKSLTTLGLLKSVDAEDTGNENSSDSIITVTANYSNIDELTSAYEEKLNASLKEIERAQQEYKNETSSFGQYLNTWLQTDYSFSKIDDLGIQNAVSQMLTNFDWSTLPKDIDENNWEEVSKYFRETFINELSSLEKDSPVAKAISELFSNPDLSLTDMESYLKLVEEYFTPDAPISIAIRYQLEDPVEKRQTMVNHVQSILQDEYDDKVGGLSLTDLEIASEKLELDPNIQLSWEELSAEIDKYKEKMAAAAEAEANFEKLSEDAANYSKAVSSTISSMDALSSAMQEQKQNGQLSLKTIDDLINSGYATALQFDGETKACTINTDAMRDLLKIKLLNQKLDLLKLQTSIAEELEKEGIAATAAANGYLSLAKGKTAAQIAMITQHNNAADQIKLLDKISIDDILSGSFTSGFQSESSSTTSYHDAFNKDYNTLKHFLEMGQLTEKEYYDNVAALNQKFFAGKKEYLDDYRRYEEEVYKGLQSYYKNHTENQLNLLEGQLDAGRISYQQYTSSVTALLEKMYGEGKISSADYFSYQQNFLAKQKDIYDRALSAITKRIEEEIDSWQHLIDGIEEQNKVLEKQKDNYDSILSVVDDVYQKEIESIKEKQNAIDDQIASLKEANEEEERSQDLANARLKLEQARNSKTRLVYDGETRQYVYKTDSDSVREAEKEVKDLELNQKISSLEKERDSLDNNIQQLEHYKLLWSEITGQHETAINQQLAKDLWGEEYESLILSNRLTDIESFRENYLDVQSKIDDNTALIESYEVKIEYYNGLKDKWSEVSSSYEEGIDSQMAAALLGQEWEAEVLSGRLETLSTFKTDYENLQQAIVDAAWQSTNEQIRAAEEAQKGADGQMGSGVVTAGDKKPPKQEAERWGLFNARNNQLVMGSFSSRPNAEKFISSAANEIGGTYSDIMVKKYHNGLLGDYPSSAPALQSTVKQIGTRRLSPDEFLAVLQKKELVINPTQQKTLLDNISTLGSTLLKQQVSSPVSPVKFLDMPKGQTINYNITMGGINLHGVQNVEDFGAEIGKRFKNVMYQNLRSMKYR